LHSPCIPKILPTRAHYMENKKKKDKGCNADLLLNFTSYKDNQRQNDHGQRPLPRFMGRPKYNPAPRIRFEKGRFAQLVRCHVLDTAPYEEIAPVIHEIDALLPWKRVQRVDMLAEKPLTCPVCLDEEIEVPKVTQCGHVYCMVCIVKYLTIDKQTGLIGEIEPRKCPVCKEKVVLSDVRTVKFQKVGETNLLALCRKNNESRGLTQCAGAPSKRYDRPLPEVPREGDEGWYFSRLIACDSTTVELQRLEELSALRAQREWCVTDRFGDTTMIPYIDYCAKMLFKDDDHIFHFEKKAFGMEKFDPYFRIQLPRVMATGEKEEQSPTQENTEGSDWNGWNNGDWNQENSDWYQNKWQPVNNEAQDSTQDPGDPSSSSAVIPKEVDDVKDGEASPHRDQTTAPSDGKSPKEDNDLNGDDTPVSHDSWLAGQDEPKSPESPESLLASQTNSQGDQVRDLTPDQGFTFYQAADGRPIFLHPFWLRPLLHTFARYHNFPGMLNVKTFEVDETSVNDYTRKTMPLLKQFPKGFEMKFLDADLRQILDASTKKEYGQQFRERTRLQREEEKRLKKQEKWMDRKVEKARDDLLKDHNITPSHERDRLPTKDDFVALPGARPSEPIQDEEDESKLGPTLAEKLRRKQNMEKESERIKREAREEEECKLNLEDNFPTLPIGKKPATNLQPIAWGKNAPKAKAKAVEQPRQIQGSNVMQENKGLDLKAAIAKQKQAQKEADEVAAKSGKKAKKKPVKLHLFG